MSGHDWKPMGSSGSHKAVTQHGTYKIHPSHAGTKRSLTYMSHKADTKPNATPKHLGYHATHDAAKAAAAKHSTRHESVAERMRDLLGEGKYLSADPTEVRAAKQAEAAVKGLQTALKKTNEAWDAIEQLHRTRIDPNMSHARAAMEAVNFLEQASAAIEEWLAEERAEQAGWKKQLSPSTAMARATA